MPLRIESVSLIQGPVSVFSLQFQAAARQAYTVQYRDALGAGEWQALAEVALAPVARPIEITDWITTGHPARFYRVIAR